MGKYNKLFFNITGTSKNKLNCFKKMINLEKQFSCFQANKVLHMIDKYPDINKETNVFSLFCN